VGGRISLLLCDPLEWRGRPKGKETETGEGEKEKVGPTRLQNEKKVRDSPTFWISVRFLED